jgi:hypothetical protein
MRSRFWLRLFLSIGCSAGLVSPALAEPPHLEVSTTTIEIVPLPDRPIHTDADLGDIRAQLAEMMQLSPQTTIKVVAPKPAPIPTSPSAPGMEVEDMDAEEVEEPEEEEAPEDADTE